MSTVHLWDWESSSAASISVQAHVGKKIQDQDSSSLIHNILVFAHKSRISLNTRVCIYQLCSSCVENGPLGSQFGPNGGACGPLAQEEPLSRLVLDQRCQFTATVVFNHNI